MAMSAYRQFILYKKVPSTRRPGKVDKFPVAIDGQVSDAHDPSNWLGVDEAVMAAELLDLDVGFVFTEDDPFFFIDIDDCLVDGQWSDMSVHLVHSFPGAAVEVSQSQKGLHIIGSYTGDEPEHGCKNIPLKLECYTSGRFVALTGCQAYGDAGNDNTTDLQIVIDGYFPASRDNGPAASDWTTTHHKLSNPISDDQTLIEKARKSKQPTNMMTGKCTFDDLWTANAEALGRNYPDDEKGRPYDESSADAALAGHLVFWTGGNCERIERLMRQSALKRDKWDYHKSYMRTTITRACRGADERSYYKMSVVPEPVTPASSGVVDAFPETARSGFQLVSGSSQWDYFKGCVYIKTKDKILTPDGLLLKSSSFNATYGGYIFGVDSDNETTTKKAWEAFTESQCYKYPKVHDTCFRPQFDTGAIIKEDNLMYANTYVPIETPCIEGDVSPFIEHTKKLLPNDRDREILISYLAACIQYKGYKFKWAPLIQGVQGNGKSLFTLVVAKAIGKRYTHMADASDIDNSFNGWLDGRLLIGVEDIFVAEHKNSVLETLKPMITGGDGIQIQRKGEDQSTKEICCNFIFNSNHKDAIRLTHNDRRFCVFYTQQQTVNDLKTQGMDEDYFYNLYEWLRAGGYANVHHYLANYQIQDQYNPTTQCQRAPTTTSTDEAVYNSLGAMEQEVMDAVEEGRTGFAGGWISSRQLDGLIDKMRKTNAIPRRKRLEMMEALGYVRHPGLKNGRVNNVIIQEGGKPVLYIKAGHIHANLTQPTEIVKQYLAAQGDPTAVASVDKPVTKV